MGVIGQWVDITLQPCCQIDRSPHSLEEIREHVWDKECTSKHFLEVEADEFKAKGGTINCQTSEWFWKSDRSIINCKPFSWWWEIAYLIRKFEGRIWWAMTHALVMENKDRSRSKGPYGQNKSRNRSKSREKIKCYHCGKLGHMKRNCKFLKRGIDKNQK